MAGTNSGFDAATFRDAISFVYDMAAAPEEEDRATFYFRSDNPAALVSADEAGLPFDPAASISRTGDRAVRVPCGIDYIDAQGALTTGFGIVTSSTLQITVLDTHYRQIEGCDYVVVGGDRYLYRRTPPASGLFDVGLHTLIFSAENET